MKIIHCADLHLDSPLNSNLDLEKAKIRQSEILNSFGNLVDYAEREDVKVVIIAGDLFDKDKVSLATEKFVLEKIENANNITFIYLLGNHDENCRFERVIPENLLIVEDDKFVFDTEEICVKALILRSKDYDFDFVKDKFNILVAHGTHNNSSDEYYIDLSFLKNKNIDYLALGHIHSMDKGELDERGVYAQCGCLDGRGFDECGIKGFMLVDTEEKSVEFIEASSRIIYEKEVDISDVSSTYGAIEKIKEALIDISENSVVRVNLIGKIDSVILLNEELILSSFKDEYFAFSIKNKTKILMDYKTYENDVSLKGEFIRICQRSDIPEEKRVKVITTVLNALESEELGV